MRQLASIRQKVIARRPAPQTDEPRIVDENVRCTGGVGTILEIIYSSVQQQGVASGIEKYGRECIVRIRLDQLSRRRVQKRLGQAIRTQVRVETGEGQPGG